MFREDSRILRVMISISSAIICVAGLVLFAVACHDTRYGMAAIVGTIAIVSGGIVWHQVTK